MNVLWVCLILVTLNILVVAWAARRVFSDASAHAPAERQGPKSILEELWLRLGDQIFDSGDYLWLRDEVSFPDAAELLARQRRELAIKWLRSLEDLFKELARTPGQNALGGDAPDARGWPRTSTVRDWRLFWSGLRFQFLLNYASIVVLLFGPYHRIVPPLSGLGSVFERKRRRISV